MKYKSLLVFSVLLAAIAVSCSKENASNSVKYQEFSGTEVEVGENAGANRLLVLNEGNFPGPSTLDLLDFRSKTYSANVFGQANPDVTQGIGSTGNELAVAGDRIWALMNASNQVVVMDKNSLKVLKILDIQSPRFMASDGTYAYITSYGAAVWGSAMSQNGLLYRVKLDTYDITSLEVGPQPEGVAVKDGKIYVANSGGYNALKSKTVLRIDAASFQQEAIFSAPVSNLKLLWASGNYLWGTSYDTYGPAPDYAIESAAGLYRMDNDGHNHKVIEGVSPSFATLVGDTLYAFGFGTMHKVSADGKVETLTFKDQVIKVKKESDDEEELSEEISVTLEGLYVSSACINPASGDIYLSVASYTGNSRLICVDKDLTFKWELESGLGAAHLLLQ